MSSTKLSAPTKPHRLQFFTACSAGNLELASGILIEQNRSSIEHKYSNEIVTFNEGFQLACESGHLNIVEWLGNCPVLGINPRADDDFALKIAVKNGHLKIVQFLVGTGIDIPTHERLNRLLDTCAETSNTEMLKYFTSLFPGGNLPYIRDIFTTALAHGNLDFLKYLVSLDAKIVKNFRLPLLDIGAGTYIFGLGRRKW